MEEQAETMREAIRMEHRLTKIEQAIVANTDVTEKLTAHVEKQNGRIDRLEGWKSQMTGVYAVILAAAPVVFWALSRWAG